MASQSKDHYTWYQRGQVGFLLPDFLEIETHIPHFYAHADNRRITIAIEFSSNSSIRRGTQEVLRGQLGVNPLLESRILRQGKIELPFRGYERIVEHRHRRDGTVDFDWGILLYTGYTRDDEYTGRSGDEFLDISIGEFREFSPESERRWRTLIDSIQRLSG